MFVVILALPGCVSLGGVTESRVEGAQLPVKPVLRSLAQTPDGGIIMDGHDAAELLIYIKSLERIIAPD